MVVDQVNIYNRQDSWKSRLSNSVVTLVDREDIDIATYEIGDAASRSQIYISSTDFSRNKTHFCLDSRDDKGLAKSAMYSCDESMSLLLGSTTSVGTLRAIANLTNDPEKGSEYMPGECCMDVATNSDFFGYRVSVARVSQNPSSLQSFPLHSFSNPYLSFSMTPRLRINLQGKKWSANIADLGI